MGKDDATDSDVESNDQPTRNDGSNDLPTDSAESNDQPTGTGDEPTSRVSRRRLLQAGAVGLLSPFAIDAVSGDTTTYPHTIIFDGREASAAVEYSFSTTGSVREHSETAALETDDSIDGASVSGVVQGDRDAYEFSGTLSKLNASPPIQVTIQYEEQRSSGPDRLEVFRSQDEYVPYAFTATDEIVPVVDDSEMTTEPSDTVAENDDGSWTAEGVTGGGWGDAYEITGDVTNFDSKGEEFQLFLNGQEVTVDELVADQTTTQESTSHRLEIVRPEESYIEYQFTTSGEMTKVLDNGDLSAEEDGDDPVQNDDGTWTVSGVTGDGWGDTFDFLGEPVDFTPRNGEFALYLDDTQVTAEELTGQTESSTDSTDQTTSDTSPVGGGQGYQNLVTRDQADVLVRSSDELERALSNASAGDVVYVPGNATIDLGSGGFVVPEGVTLASNRGVDDAPGATLYTDQEADECFSAHDARITGIRLRGAHPGGDTTGSTYAGGILAHGAVEVDNCDIWGFAHDGIRTHSGGDAHIHHNVIRECNKSGLGYGVDASSGHPLIEYNYFNYNRHSVASAGENHGYTLRYNHFGPDTTDHVIDVHPPGGDTIEIYNNTVEAVVARDGGDAINREGRQRPAVTIRGVPDTVADIHDNWFYNPDPPLDSPSGWTEEAIIQVEVDEWRNVEWNNNHYGESDPGSGIGHPR